MSHWSVNKKEGFATGPSEEIAAGDTTVSVAAYWTAEDGVCVAIDTHDGLLVPALAADVCAAVLRLSATPAPELTAT